MFTSISIKFDRIVYGCIAAAIGAGSANATTWYVSNNGSDGNSGTSASAPFQSFWEVNQHLASGDTLAIMPGTYQNFGVGVSGTPGNPTIITAQDPANPPLIVGGTYPAVWVQANYVTVSYLEVTTGQQSLAAGLQVWGSNHVTIEKVVAHDCGGGGIMAGWGDYFTLNKNTTYNNSYAAPNQTSGISLGAGVNSDTNPGTHNIVSNNISYNNIDLVPVPGTNYTTDGSGIIIDTLNMYGEYVGNTLVYNNLVYNNGGSGIRTFKSDHVYITNNTSVGNLQDTKQNGFKGEISVNIGNHIIVRNNVIQATTPTAYPLTDVASTGNFYNYNLTSGGMSQPMYTWSSNALFARQNMFNQNPQFLPGSFMVAPGSPVLGAANGGVSPLRDIRGDLRPTTHVGTDLGAYQQSS